MQKYSTRQATALSTMALIGQTLIMYNGMPAKTDVWLSVIVAFVASLPLILLAARLVNVFPGKDLYDLQLDLFGNIAGRITSALYVLFSLHIGSLVLKDMTNFIQITSLMQTPQYVTAVFTGVLCIYCVKSGINTLARYTAMALPVYLLIIAGTTLLSTTMWAAHYSHLPPLLYNGAGPMLKSAMSLTFFPFAEIMMMPLVLQRLKEQHKAKMIFLTASGINAALLMLFFMRNMLVLGDNFTFTQYFPGYVAVSLIDIADFLQRIEVAVGAVLFMGAFVKITIYLYVVSLGLSKVLGFGDYRRFVAPVGILMLTLSVFAYGNIVENVDFASGFFPYYGFSFRILIPVAVWILAERKRKKLKREGRLPEPPPAEEETPVERQGGNAPQNTEQAADSPVDGRPQPS